MRNIPWPPGLILILSIVGCSDGTTAADAAPLDHAVPAGDGALPGDDAGTPVKDAALPDLPPPPPVTCDPLPATQVIGNWDLVPHQRIDGPFEVGVVAFHEQGVDVELSVNGAKVALVNNPSANPRTKAFEYWTTINAGDYPDGPITLGATILPDCPAHQLRKLEDRVLYANAGGSLTNSVVKWADCAKGSDQSGDGSKASPYETIEKALVEVGDGGTVYLAAGDCYKLTKLYKAGGYKRWTTVQPGPGLTRAEVGILAEGGGAAGRFGEDMVRWKDVRMYKDVAPGHSTLFYFESGHSAWFDGAELYDNNGRFGGGSVVGGNQPYSVYTTDTLIRDVANVTGISNFFRNVKLKNIGSDIYRASSNMMSVNVTIDTIDVGATSAHPDFFQLYAPGATVDNIVIYNTKAYNMGAQGIFGGEGNLRNVAFVNLLMEKDPPDSALTSQLSGSWEHVLLWHVTTVDAGFLIKTPKSLKHFYVQNNVWHNFHAAAETSLPGSVIDHNLFQSLVWNQPKPMGTNAQVDDPKFEDVGSDDYRLSAGSPAKNVGVPLPGVPADVDGKPYDGTKPNLGAFAN